MWGRSCSFHLKAELNQVNTLISSGSEKAGQVTLNVATNLLHQPFRSEKFEMEHSDSGTIPVKQLRIPCIKELVQASNTIKVHWNACEVQRLTVHVARKALFMILIHNIVIPMHQGRTTKSVSGKLCFRGHQAYFPRFTARIVHTKRSLHTFLIVPPLLTSQLEKP
jgi:hypothetical protein